MTVNPKTRPPPMCPGKKILGHLCQEMRCCYKFVLQSMLLKDSPRTEPVRNWVDNLQKEKKYYETPQHFCIAKQTNTRLSRLEVLVAYII